MSAIQLQPGIIYCPVLSRRLGRSLGINLLPTNCKVCSFDCIYCQYGEAKPSNKVPMEGVLPIVDDVLSAVEKAFNKPRTIENVTFSGNGEPTLHPDFHEIVVEIKKIQHKLRPEARLAILSNGSKINDPNVFSALKLMDKPMMKLDAGDENTFRLINRGIKTIRLNEIVEGLKRLPNLLIQSMLIDGEISNIKGYAYESWAEVLGALQPREVHIYSVDRPTAKGKIKCVSPVDLQRIEEDLNTRFNLNVQAFWREK